MFLIKGLPCPTLPRTRRSEVQKLARNLLRKPIDFADGFTSLNNERNTEKLRQRNICTYFYSAQEINDNCLIAF